MAARQECLLHSLPKMGTTSRGHVCNRRQQEMSTLCISRREREGISRRCLYGTMERGSTLSLPSPSTLTEDHCQDYTGESGGHIDCSLVATSTMVFHASSNSNGQSDTALASTSTHSEQRKRPSSRPRDAPLDSVEDFPLLTKVIDKARKPATKLLYQYKWKAFLKFTEERALQPSPVALSVCVCVFSRLVVSDSS